METRRIGSLEVSVVGLGTNSFGVRMSEAESAAVVNAGLDAGINHFDTADVYGSGKSEEFLGRALGRRRDEAVIATKYGAATGGSVEVTRKAVEAALVRLGTDRIDLMYLHKPDPNTPVAETLGALDECVRAGKLREIACSTFDAGLLREADLAGQPRAAKFAAVQNYLNLLHRDDLSLLPVVEELGMAYVPFFPLEMGMLTGKYVRGEPPPPGTRLATYPEDRQAAVMTDDNFDVVADLMAWAAGHGHSIVELAIAWLASLPAVASVIAGASRPEQVRTNAAAGEWALTPAEVAEVTEIAARRSPAS
jgi:aryl-alcohol dehydrogenase-like predicted oxidoreductase